MRVFDMELFIRPSALRGFVTPPASKSQAHRVILAQALSDEPGTILNLSVSQDIEATKRCLEALQRKETLLDCGESGSTLRFLIPVALALRGGAQFTGHGRLMERPQQPYFDIFDEKGIYYEQKNGVLTLRGELHAGIFQLPGNVSSQFVTGLLYALPLLEGDSEIVLTTPLESRDYVSMTLEVLRSFGILAENRAFSRILIPGSQRFRGRDFTIESDWSQAAFWYAANLLGGDVKIRNMDLASAQGDRVILDHARRLAEPGDVEIDVSGCPDLAPPLAAMAAMREGSVRLENAERLRLKESDRLTAIRETLDRFGVPAEETRDSLTICGVRRLRGGAVESCNDHRIAMMAAVLATRADEPVILRGAEAVAKSYPKFWEDYAALGGDIREM